MSKRATSTAYGLSYAVALPVLRDTARLHGYALAVHGSMATDLDLIAVPWVEEASDTDMLAEALRECIGGSFVGGSTAAEARGLKPHGRIAYTIVPSDLFLGVPRLPWQPWIDLSVMPAVSRADL